MSESIAAASIILVILFCIPVIYFDLRCKIIPNAITYAGILIGLVMLIFFRQAQFMNYALGLIVGFGLFYILHLFGWVGGGDVKLMAMIGVLLGGRFLAQALFSIALAGGLLALMMVVFLAVQRKPIRGAAVPYGTAIVAGTYYTLWTQLSAGGGL